MAFPRLSALLMIALAAIAAGVAPALGQQRSATVGQAGQVGQSLDQSQTNQLRGGTTPTNTLTTLEDETKAEDARRKARDRARATAAAAGSPVINPRTKVATQKPVRNLRGLGRISNKAVSIPTAVPVSTTPGAPMPGVIAPGLSDPIFPKKKKIVPEEPYAPTGLRLGGIKVLPAIESAAGYDSNALRSSSGTKTKGSRLYQVTPELSLQSDWSRHALQFDLRGSYSYYADVDNANRPNLDAKLTLRGDVKTDSVVTLELKEKVDSQRPGSADLSSAVKGRPLYYVTSGSLGWAEKFGYATVTATGTIDRSDYQDGTTFSGGTLSQKDRNYTAYGGKLRGAYELSPGISPFVEVSADTRSYDEKVDTSGYRRSSVGVVAKVGTTLELTRTLTGEVSVGWGARNYDDTRLANLTGAVVDTSLIWQLSPVTKATLKAGTEFAETSQGGSSGALGRKVSLEVAHDLLRNLTITSTAGFARADYQGISRIEDTINAGLKLDYRIDRNFVVRSSYAFDRALSSTAGQSNLSHTFLMGLRVQR